MADEITTIREAVERWKQHAEDVAEWGAINAALTALAALQEERERLYADSLRLDWLESNAQCCDQFGSGSDDYWWKVLFDDGHQAEGATPRAAIDAAIGEPAIASVVEQSSETARQDSGSAPLAPEAKGEQCECPAQNAVETLRRILPAINQDFWKAWEVARTTAGPCPCKGLRAERDEAQAEVTARLKQCVAQIEIHSRNTSEWRAALDTAEAERDSLRAELANATAYAIQLERRASRAEEYCRTSDQELAASQERERGLREALEDCKAQMEAFADQMAGYPNYGRAIDAAVAALATPEGTVRP